MPSDIDKLKADINNLKDSLLIYDRPPKENEGLNNALWIDKKNNKIFVKDKKEGWIEIGRTIFMSDVSPTPADGQDGDLWFEY